MPLWTVKCWTASLWTGSPGWVLGRTSRSWWSSRDTGAHWWSSGHAVGPVLEYLHGKASRLSRRWRSWRLFLVQKLMHWWVSWGRWRKTMPPPPPRPWQCWWLYRSTADFSTGGQSLPGEPPPAPSQRCPAEEAVAAVLAFLRCPERGRLRAPLPTPAWKDWSRDMVLWTVVVKGKAKCSNTEVLDCWFFLVEEVFFVLVWLVSLGFWTNVTEEPAILSACRMVRTHCCRTLGSGPRTWDPSKGAVLTVLRTCGWKPKFLSRESRRNSCRLKTAAKPADTAATWASVMIANFSHSNLDR